MKIKISKLYFREFYVKMKFPPFHNYIGTTSDRLSDQLSPGAVAKSLLGKFTMRKASVLSISSIGSFADRKSNSSTEELYPNGNKSEFFSVFKEIHLLLNYDV